MQGDAPSALGDESFALILYPVSDQTAADVRIVAAEAFRVLRHDG